MYLCTFTLGALYFLPVVVREEALISTHLVMYDRYINMYVQNVTVGSIILEIIIHKLYSINIHI